MVNSAGCSPGMTLCYSILPKVSRSFARVIIELDKNLRDPICIFYLVLRALDTIEDDMSIDTTKKIETLQSFYKKLVVPGWNFSCGSGAEKQLIESFHIVIEEFSKLDLKYRIIISEITQQMGSGMSEFITKQVETTDDYNLYCHYVAGLVGIGLSKMFGSSGLEDPELASMEQLSNSMGLFLQKTNIIRDYLEDINQNRIFWPKQIWSKYASSLEEFKDIKNQKKAVYCLNELVTDALSHVPDCINYLARIKNPANFNFCAIPQVMAIETLALITNSKNIFTGVVKIKRLTTLKIIFELQMKRMNTVTNRFACCSEQIISKISTNHNDPSFYKLQQRAQIVIDLVGSKAKKSNTFGAFGTILIAALILIYKRGHLQQLLKHLPISALNPRRIALW